MYIYIHIYIYISARVCTALFPYFYTRQAAREDGVCHANTIEEYLKPESHGRRLPQPLCPSPGYLAPSANLKFADVPNGTPASTCRMIACRA